MVEALMLQTVAMSALSRAVHLGNRASILSDGFYTFYSAIKVLTHLA